MHAIHSIHTRLGSGLSVMLPTGAVIILAGFAVVAPSLRRTPPPVNSAADTTHRFPLEISPDSLSFGELEQGQLGMATIDVYNPTGREWNVERIGTSCPCVTIAPQSTQIGPGDKKTLGVQLNPSDDPDFVGSLSVDVIGYAASGGIAFRTRVDVEIRAKAGDRISSWRGVSPKDAQP